LTTGRRDRDDRVAMRPIDEQLLRRAIRLAMSGRGLVEPNPMVGCVLASPQGEVLGEGWHIRFGGAHAEPTALQDAAGRQNAARGGHAYVTLEPCCHTNKKTPPCAPRLIAAGVARVLVGCLDPNPDVNGKGIAMLRAAGIEVEIAPPTLRDECRQLIAPFVALTTHRRPYVTIKWAETADGHVAGPRGQRLKITNAASDLLIHTLRARCDAIAVGTNTVLSDDPLLTARGPSFGRVVRRVILSNTLKVPMTSRLVQTARQTPTIVLLLGIINSQPPRSGRGTDRGGRGTGLVAGARRRTVLRDRHAGGSRVPRRGSPVDRTWPDAGKAPARPLAGRSRVGLSFAQAAGRARRARHQPRAAHRLPGHRAD
jgi:riboflavin biosynthesis protein RibD